MVWLHQQLKIKHFVIFLLRQDKSCSLDRTEPVQHVVNCRQPHKNKQHSIEYGLSQYRTSHEVSCQKAFFSPLRPACECPCLCVYVAIYYMDPTTACLLSPQITCCQCRPPLWELPCTNKLQVITISIVEAEQLQFEPKQKCLRNIEYK